MVREWLPSPALLVHTCRRLRRRRCNVLQLQCSPTNSNFKLSYTQPAAADKIQETMHEKPKMPCLLSDANALCRRSDLFRLAPRTHLPF
jgi:hypothetical protein